MAQIRAIYQERAATLVAEGEAVSLYPAVISALAEGNPSPLRQWAGQVASLQGTSVTVTDAAGKVVARGHHPELSGDELASHLEGLRLALAGQKVSGTELGDELGLALRGYAPVMREGEVVGAVMMAEPLHQLLERLTSGERATATSQVASALLAEGCDTASSASATCRFSLASPTGRPAATLELVVPLLEIEEARRDAQRWLWMTGGLVMVISGLLAGSLARPLARLTAAAHRMASGDYDQPAAAPAGNDEIGVLARAFDRMRQEVARTTTSLREERDVFDAVLESVEAGILLTDMDGQTLVSNSRWTQLLGGEGLPAAAHLVRVDAAGGTFADAARDWLADRQRHAQGDFEQWGPGYQCFRCYTAPVRHRPASGTGPDEARAIGRIFALRDVTRESEAERMRSALVATVSHELRSPLTAIKGYTDTLLQGGPWDHQTEREFLEIVALSAEKLSLLVENLLDAAQVEAGVLSLHPEPVRVERVIREIILQRQPLMPDHPLDLEAPSHLPLAEADPVRVEQVIINLIDNAIKYSPGGGPIRIQIEDGEMLTVKVSDCGLGIAPEHLGHLFDRFYRVEDGLPPKTKGLGLGLFICKGLIEAQGGQMGVESRLGVGSTFFFTLPKVADVAGDAKATGPYSHLSEESMV
jgi:signal transduction histidine kinase/HAMP domain-containing protein